MKYHNKPLDTPDGKFDSRWEHDRWLALRAMERAGTIERLSRQVRFEVIPAQFAPETIGPRGGRHGGKCLEKKCEYIADFVYWQDGEMVVEDAKGMQTPEYVIKRKLMLWQHGIQIREVHKDAGYRSGSRKQRAD